MSYAPTTDFLALLRQTGNGVRTVQMPALDFVSAALARMGIFKVWVASTAPVSFLSSTVWVRPASPSWASEAAVLLYNSATAQFELATPALWTALFISAAVPQVQALLGQQRILITRSVDFNAIADTIFPIALPAGFTRFVMSAIRISGANGTLTTATAGLFTAPAAGGVAVMNAGTAITVSSAADATNNNTQAMGFNNGNTQSYAAVNNPSLYFRVTNPQGAARLADVSLSIDPVP